MRFLPNPHYEADLRELTGLDAEVVDYIAATAGSSSSTTTSSGLLDYLLPAVRDGGQGASG